MNITRLELRKTLINPITIIAFIAILFLNVFTLLVGGSQDSYTASAPAFSTNIAQAQENGAYFAGEINDEWAQKFIVEVEAIRNNPENWVSENEREQIRQNLIESGMSEEGIDALGNYIYVKEEIARSNEYNRYESVEFSAKFYEIAKSYSAMYGTYYRETYPGEKGEALAAKAEQMYDDLAEEYTAYYNYDLGYQKLRNMLQTYPYTVGLLILIALSPIFSSEYAKRTDSLLLTSKHGKRKLIFSKIKAGLIFAILVWAVVTLVNIIMVAFLYGTTGWEAYWQNWSYDSAPFVWNQGQATIAALLTSLLGGVFLALFTMLISSFSKNQFVSIIIGAVLLLFPMMDFAFTNNVVIQSIYRFLPTVLLMGINEWQSFGAVYLFGNAVLIQYVALTVTALLCGLCIPISKRFFKRHQVAN